LLLYFFIPMEFNKLIYRSPFQKLHSTWDACKLISISYPSGTIREPCMQGIFNFICIWSQKLSICLETKPSIHVGNKRRTSFSLPQPHSHSDKHQYFWQNISSATPGAQLCILGSYGRLPTMSFCEALHISSYIL